LESNPPCCAGSALGIEIMQLPQSIQKVLIGVKQFEMLCAHEPAPIMAPCHVSYLLATPATESKWATARVHHLPIQV
jgi:hypothetical protein